ncbi:MAG: YetF domain-containing protein [Betaproteobacteria bacterium]
MTLARLLGSAPSLPLWAFIVRSVLIYGALILFTRLSGRREVARLDAYSFIVAITVGSLASPPLADPRSSVLVALGVIGVFYTLHLLLFFLEQSSPLLAKLVGDEPLVLVENGKVVEDNLMKAHYNMDNLQMQLRLKGAFSPGDVEFAILEPSGDMSVILKSQARPATPADLGLKPPAKGWPVTLIADGQINEENLRMIGRDEQWIRDVLRAKGITDLKDVLYLAIDQQGNIYADFIRPSQFKYLK